MRCRSPYVVAAALFCIGCGPSVTSDRSVTTTSEGQTSEGAAGTTAAHRGNVLVRFVNADLEGSGADVVSADRKLFSKVAPKGVTGYLEIQRGRVQFGRGCGCSCHRFTKPNGPGGGKQDDKKKGRWLLPSPP